MAEENKVGSFQEEVLKALQRFGERIEGVDKRLKLVEMFKVGFDERLGNMEEFLKTKFLDAQKNIEELNKLMSESDDPLPKSEDDGETPASVGDAS